MSNVYNNDPEYGSAAESSENPYAVWIRDIPSWMTKERFYNGITDWTGVIKDKSHFFKNKQNPDWNGWAKVTFTSNRARNGFIENREKHNIQFAEGEPRERLRVTPWFDKNKSNSIPLYKNFEKERSALKSGSEVNLEDFEKNVANNWNSSYKGVIGHYFTDKAGNGHVGYIELKVLARNVKRTELIIFHSDSIWMCFKHDACNGTNACAIRCGVDNFLPKRLPIGSEVFFTARKIPRGVAGNKCYQANSIWLGSHSLPDFVKVAPVKKLDEYLEDFKKEAGLVGGSPSKELTPENLKESLSSSRSNSGSSSPTPALGQIPARQKPLTGGLKQLGGKLEVRRIVQTTKKQPANFAQAVSRPTLSQAIVDEQTNLILAIGVIESIISETEAVLIVPDYGKFTLNIKQLDLGYTPTYSLGSYINPKTDTVSVTLKPVKPVPGGSKTIKYDIVGADINKPFANPKVDPFSDDQQASNGIGSGCDSWEDLADEDFVKCEYANSNNSNKNGGTTNMDNSDNDINAGAELDDYFDNLQEIMDYLERELPKVLPTTANDTDTFQQLSDSIIGSENESYVLKDFLVAQGVSQRVITVFVDEFSKYRNLYGDIEEISISENGDASKSSDGDIVTLSSCSTPEIINMDGNTIRFKSEADLTNSDQVETNMNALDQDFREKIGLDNNAENSKESKKLEGFLERFMLDYFLKHRGKNSNEFANIEKERTMSHIMATGWATIDYPLNKIKIIFEKKDNPEFEPFYEELFHILSKEMSGADMDLEVCSGLTAIYFIDGWYKNGRNNRNSGDMSDDQDRVSLEMETQELVLSFLNWVKQVVRNKEMLTEKTEFYADVLQNQRNLIKVWAKIVRNKDKPFISFLGKPYLDKRSEIELRVWLLSKQYNYKKFKDMFVSDTNTFRLEIANDEAKNKVMATRQKRINLGLDLETSQLEEEFIVHQDKAKETRAFILRAIAFMKKCGVSLDLLAEMHNTHLRENPKLKNKEFKMKIENILFQKGNQKSLDETNALMQKQSKSKEHTPYSYTRVDRYIPILSHCLCGFFVDRLDAKSESNSSRGESVPKSPSKSASNGDIPSQKGDAAAINAATRKRRLSQTDGEKEKKLSSKDTTANSNETVAKTGSFVEEDYTNLKNFLEISIESRTIDLPSNVSLDGILSAFQARDIPFNKLESIYQKTNAGDSTMWRLEISQLRLNPPVGVTVPQLADMLFSYFETVGLKVKETKSQSADSVKAVPSVKAKQISNKNHETRTAEEASLLSYMQGNLYNQFYTDDLRKVSNTLSSGGRDLTRVGEFGNMMTKLQEVYKSHQLYNMHNNNRWRNFKLETDLSKLCALLTSAVWWDLKVTLDYLRNGVKDLTDNNKTTKELMTDWAKLVESSDIFPGSLLDIVTIIKATMMYFNVFKTKQTLSVNTEIVTDLGLYNVRGVVTQHLSNHFAVVQTPYGLVLCHNGTVYIECSKNSKAMVPVKHWSSCLLKECLPVGTRVLLHGSRMKEGATMQAASKPIVCQVATLVWRSGRNPRNPPETGPLLPGSKQYFELISVQANKYAKNNVNVFSNVSEEENLLKYNLALEAVNQEKRGITCNGSNESSNNASNASSVDEEEASEVATIWEDAGLDINYIRRQFVNCKLGGMTMEWMKGKWAKCLSKYYNYSMEDKAVVINRSIAYLKSDSLTKDILAFAKPAVKKNGVDKTMELVDEAYPQSIPRCMRSSSRRRSPDSDESPSPDEDELLAVSENDDDGKEHDTIHDESMQQAQRHLEQLIMDNDLVVDNDAEVRNSTGKKGEKKKEVENEPELSTSTEIVVASEERRSPAEISKDKETSVEVSNELERATQQRPPIDQATLEAMALKIEDLHYWQLYTKQYIENNAEFQLNQDAAIKNISTRLTSVEDAIKSLSETLKAVPTEQRSGAEKTTKGRIYVKIIKAGDGDDVNEVPTNSLGLLPQSTVKALYEGTSAIKYRVTPSSKTSRTLLLEDDLYHPPEDGWGDRIYHCTIPEGMLWKGDPPQAKNCPPLSRAPGTAPTLDGTAYTADSLASPYPATSLSMGAPPSSLSMGAPPSSLPMFSSTTANSLPVINVNPAFLTGLPGIPLLGQQQQQTFPAGYHLAANMKPAKPWFMKPE